MATTQIAVERTSIVSSRSIDQILATLDAQIGHPDMNAFWQTTAAAHTAQEVEQPVRAAIGPSGFMLFMRFNHGQYLEKTGAASHARIFRYLIGNPLIMKEMARHVPDAGSYAPVTVLVSERPDGVHLTYDRMASYLASYNNAAALQVARELDAKVETLLRSAAG